MGQSQNLTALNLDSPRVLPHPLSFPGEGVDFAVLLD